MTSGVLGKTLRDQQRALIGWGTGTAALVALMAAMWPSVRDVFAGAALEAFPEPLLKLFEIDAIATGAGFLNTEAFSILLPLVFIAYGIGRGAQLVAGEEQDGTLELLVVSRVPRVRLVLEKAAGLALALVLLGVVLWIATMSSSLAMGMGVPAGHAANGALAMTLLGLLHGTLALAVGAASGRRALAIAVAATLATVGYVLHVLGALVEAVDPWRALSPFTQAIGEGPVSGTTPAGFAWLALVALVLVAAALPPFARRDIGAA